MLLWFYKKIDGLKWILVTVISLLLIFPYNCLLVSGDNQTVGVLQTFFLTDIHAPLHILFISLTIVFSGIIFHSILIAHQLVEKQNYTGFLFSLLLISFWRNADISYFDSVSVFLFILVVFRLFQSDSPGNQLLRYLDSGLLIGILILLQTDFWITILIPYFSIIVFRQYKWRNWLVSAIGLFLPYVFVSGYQIMLTGELYPLNIQSSFNLNYHLFATFYAKPWLWTVYGFTIIIVFFNSIFQLSDKKIHLRKKNIFLLYLLFVLLIPAIFSVNIRSFSVLFIFLITGYFISFGFKKLSSSKISRIVVDILFIGSIFLKLFRIPFL